VQRSPAAQRAAARFRLGVTVMVVFTGLVYLANRLRQRYLSRA